MQMSREDAGKGQTARWPLENAHALKIKSQPPPSSSRGCPVSFHTPFRDRSFRDAKRRNRKRPKPEEEEEEEKCSRALGSMIFLCLPSTCFQFWNFIFLPSPPPPPPPPPLLLLLVASVAAAVLQLPRRRFEYPAVTLSSGVVN